MKTIFFQESRKIKKAAKESYFFSVLNGYHHFLLKKTTFFILIFFTGSLVNLGVCVFFKTPVSMLAVIIRFFLISFLFISFSEEKFWVAAKRTSHSVLFFRRLAKHLRQE